MITVPKIGQSLMKDYLDYRAGRYCGLQFVASHIDGVDLGGSDAMALGNYFEYHALGNPTRSGEIPVAEMTKGRTLKDGTVKGQEMTAPYQRATTQAANFRKMIEHYQIEILERNLEIETDGMRGRLDFIGTIPGSALGMKTSDRVPFIGDLKYSGLLENKWEDYGWDEESLQYKDKILIQWVHYSTLYHAKYGKPAPFLFFVYSSTNDIDSKIILLDFPDESRRDSHLRDVEFVRRGLEMDLEIGMVPVPDIRRCSTCPIGNCPRRMTIPSITRVPL